MGNIEVATEYPSRESLIPEAAFLGALAKAQGELGPLLKTAKVDYRDNRGQRIHFGYATLSDVLEAVLPVLSRHGLAVIQNLVNGDDGLVGVRTRLGHKEGYSVDSVFYFRPTRTDIQSIGSVITYLRRYSLMALVGVSPASDDDDGAGGTVGLLASRPALPDHLPDATAGTQIDSVSAIEELRELWLKTDPSSRHQLKEKFLKKGQELTASSAQGSVVREVNL